MERGIMKITANIDTIESNCKTYRT